MGIRRDKDTGRKDSMGRPIYESSTKNGSERAGSTTSGKDAPGDFSSTEDSTVEVFDTESHGVFMGSPYATQEISSRIEASIENGKARDMMVSSVFEGNVPDDFHDVMDDPDNINNNGRMLMLMGQAHMDHRTIEYDDTHLMISYDAVDDAADSIRNNILSIYRHAQDNVSSQGNNNEG